MHLLFNHVVYCNVQRDVFHVQKLILNTPLMYCSTQYEENIETEIGGAMGICSCLPCIDERFAYQWFLL